MKATIQCEHHIFIFFIGNLFLMTAQTQTTNTNLANSNRVTNSAAQNQSSVEKTATPEALNKETRHESATDVGYTTEIMDPSTGKALNSGWHLSTVLNPTYKTQDNSINTSKKPINATSGEKHYFTKTNITPTENVLRVTSTITSTFHNLLKHSTGNTETSLIKTKMQTNYTVHPPRLPTTTVFRTKDNREDNKTLCLEKTNKSELVICLIIIGVLAILCTVLLISTVVLKNQLSNFKKANHKVRQARSNADFLTRTSLWPAGSDTWNMRSNLSESSTMLEEVDPKTVTLENMHARQKETSINTDGNKHTKESKAVEVERGQTNASASFVLEI
ncbi:protein EVI2A [Protopterus annectens]|uniref:protein EVI2A n=1 Tax=Protopterus annectens TaxID=7888 RepID=UPI001CFA5025|nr:protein EVI2A [Protopterus annectens]